MESRGHFAKTLKTVAKDAGQVALTALPFVLRRDAEPEAVPEPESWFDYDAYYELLARYAGPEPEPEPETDPEAWY